MKLSDGADNKYEWYAYTRIGLYYVTRSARHINICDIHLGGLGPESMGGGFYTGPTDCVDQIETLTRTEQDVHWGDHFETNSYPDNLGLAGGGLVHALSHKTRKTFHIWLYGPLLFNKIPYGSLVAELHGMKFPKRAPYKDIPLDETGERIKTDFYEADSEYNPYQIIFPKSYRSPAYKRCILWGNDFSLGRHSHTKHPQLWSNAAYGDLNKQLGAAWKKKWTAPLPQRVVRMAWKIENCASGLTMAQLYNRRG